MRKFQLFYLSLHKQTQEAMKKYDILWYNTTNPNYKYPIITDLPFNKALEEIVHLIENEADRDIRYTLA